MASNNKGRKELITLLQRKAKEIFDLKKKHRQKRPVIIEFSGSPKSGKTTCINSLELFLKRNGFEVEVVQERASICPVADKKSPMFNIWTACHSIAGMITGLERKAAKCDVLILDRGIFDAFCWLDWLYSKGNIGKEDRESIEKFLSIDFIIKRIDIVFAFTVEPSDSIEREYANLLTDKPGTIMSEKTLTEYFDSVKNIIKNKQQYFHKVIPIDTTKKKQDDVGKEVTEKTLEALKLMLMESIGYVTPPSATMNTLKYTRFISCENKDMNEFFGEFNFGLRDKVEDDVNFIQLIPIAVITDTKHKTILTVKKRKEAISKDSPEKDKILLYVGGHSRAEDVTDISSKDLLSVCRYTLRREVNEELGIMLSFDEISPYIIYTPDSSKDKRHLAICFLIENDDINELKLKIDTEELTLNRGSSKSGTFQEIKDIVKKNKFEPWSEEIIKNLFSVSIEKKGLF